MLMSIYSLNASGICMDAIQVNIEEEILYKKRKARNATCV